MLCAFRRASVGIARRSVDPAQPLRPRASAKGASHLNHPGFTFTRAVSQMADAPSRGAFVVFEGVDRCGKSSQTKQLVEALNARGIAAELWCYPDRTTDIGKMINAYLTNNADLSDAAVHLLFSANRWEKRWGGATAGPKRVPCCPQRRRSVPVTVRPPPVRPSPTFAPSVGLGSFAAAG